MLDSRNRFSKAFTLVEIMLGVFLLATVVALSLTILRRPGRASVRGAAETVAEVLRSAHQRAASGREVVAIGFPSQNGAIGASDSYYLLAGSSKPRLLRSRALSGDFPDISLFSSVHSSSTSVTVSDLRRSATNYQLNNWSSPFPKDPHLIFLPNGEVTSNGLPRFGGSYHVVVSSGMVLSGNGPPGGTAPVNWPPNYFSLDQVGECATIVVEPSGGIWVEDAIPNSSLTPDRNLGPPPVAAAVIASSFAPTNAPQVDALRVVPDPSTTVPPPGVDALVEVDHHLTLQLEASSPEAVPLICEWTEESVGATTGPGSFTAPEGEEMRWDPTLEKWVSNWSWAPPPGSQGQRFRLRVRVYDPFGNTAPDSSLTQVDLEVSPSPTRLSLTSDRLGVRQGFIVRGDGSGLEQVTNFPNDVIETHLSPDGTKVVSVRSGDLYLSDADGSNMTPIVVDPAREYSPFWDTQGRFLVFHSDRGGLDRLYRWDFDGTVSDLLPSLAGFNTYQGAVSLDGAYIAFISDRFGAADLFVLDLASSGVTRLTLGTGNTTFPSFNRADSDLLTISHDQSGTPEMYTVRVSAPGTLNQQTTGADAVDGKFAAGSDIVFRDTANRLFRVGSATPILGGCVGFTTLSDGTIYATSNQSGNLDIYKISPADVVENITNHPGRDQLMRTTNTP